jgi:thiamine-phosphate diphosphorylase / hydroxyethylthiazole kinase
VTLEAPHVKKVAIGGLNAQNIDRVRYQSETPWLGARLDGVAVVSALMSADDPIEAARHLKGIFDGNPPFARQQKWIPQPTLTVEEIKSEISTILMRVQEITPLVHHLTNNVHLLQNLS